MDPRKIEAIVEQLTLTKILELRSFFGFANYYRKFIVGYSKKVSPLTDLLKKNERWKWSTHCQDAYEKLKAVIVMLMRS